MVFSFSDGKNKVIFSWIDIIQEKITRMILKCNFSIKYKSIFFNKNQIFFLKRKNESRINLFRLFSEKSRNKKA